MSGSAEATATPAELDTPVERGLRAAWRKETSVCLARGLGWMLACLVLLVLVDLALDWWWDLPAYARLALLVLNLAALAMVACCQLWRRLRRYRPVEMALRAEKLNCGVDGLLVSCVQFGPDVVPPYGVSADLIGAVRRQASERARTIDFSRIADTRQLRPAQAAAVALLAVVIAAACWQPQFFRVLGCRMLNPWSTAAYPTRTTIEACTGDLTVRQAEAVRLQASAGGEIPDEGRLFLRVKGAGWESVPVARQDRADFGYVLPHGSEDFDYYFALGDARSRRFHVTVAHPPRITETRVQLRYPRYTKLPAREVSTMNLRFPEGTEVSWELRLDRPVVAAEMVLEDKAAHPLELDATSATARLRQVPEASSSYTLRFRWKLGDREYVDQNARHYLQLIPDSDPRAGLTRPFEDGKATLSKIVDLVYWAKDDYGLDEAWIVYTLNDGREQRYSLGSLGGEKSVDDREVSWPIARVITDLKEGDIVTFAVEVSDVRVGPGHRGRSHSRRLQFVSPQQYLAYVLARQRKYLGQLRPLYLQEMDAGAHLRAIQAAETPSAATARPANNPSLERKP